MIRDAEHPVLGGGMGFVGVFFTLYGCEENRPVSAGFLKVVCVWNYLAVPNTGHFLRAAVKNSPPALVNQRCQ